MADLDVAANFKANKAFLASICSYFVANFMKTMIVTFTKDGKLVLIPKKLSLIITKNKMLRWNKAGQDYPEEIGFENDIFMLIF